MSSKNSILKHSKLFCFICSFLEKNQGKISNLVFIETSDNKKNIISDKKDPSILAYVKRNQENCRKTNIYTYLMMMIIICMRKLTIVTFKNLKKCSHNLYMEICFHEGSSPAKSRVAKERVYGIQTQHT